MRGLYDEVRPQQKLLTIKKQGEKKSWSTIVHSTVRLGEPSFQSKAPNNRRDAAARTFKIPSFPFPGNGKQHLEYLGTQSISRKDSSDCTLGLQVHAQSLQSGLTLGPHRL